MVLSYMQVLLLGLVGVCLVIEMETIPVRPWNHLQRFNPREKIAVDFLKKVLNKGNSRAAIESVCLDWIDNFWDFLTVGENGPATKVDFQRFFNYMDNDADGKVTRPQFTDVWMPTTLMTFLDSDTVFQKWALISANDSSVIRADNWNEVFIYYARDAESEVITKPTWTEKWQQDLPEMPNRGCPGPDLYIRR